MCIGQCSLDFNRKKLIVANIAEYMKKILRLKSQSLNSSNGMQNSSRLEEIMIKRILEIATSAIEILNRNRFDSQYLLDLEVKLFNL